MQVNRTMLEFYWIMRRNLVEKKPEPTCRTGGIKQLSVGAANQITILMDGEEYVFNEVVNFVKNGE